MNNGIRTLMMSTSVALAMFASQADASVVIAGTRVIFPGQDKEATVQLNNAGQLPALVQAWLDEGDAAASPEAINVPFTLTPAMFRLDPGNGQALRLLHTGAALPRDRESLYWLNVLEVPPKVNDDANRLQLAVRTRIKVMYRPAGLPGKAADAPAAVRWELRRQEDGTGYALKASNPTPYYVNYGSISLGTGNGTLDAGGGHVAPGSSKLFPLAASDAAVLARAEVQYSAINDWGGASQGVQTVSAPTP